MKFPSLLNNNHGKVSLSLARWVIITFLILFFLPFVFIQTIFPFYRFGMFAEPGGASGPREKLVVRYYLTSGESGTLAPEDVKLSPNQFNYLLRNYFYRGESELFLKNAHQIAKKTGVLKWGITKKGEGSSQTASDSVVIYWTP